MSERASSDGSSSSRKKKFGKAGSPPPVVKADKSVKKVKASEAADNQKRRENALERLARAANEAKRGSQKLLKKTAKKAAAAKQAAQPVVAPRIKASSTLVKRKAKAAKERNAVQEEPQININELTAEQTEKMIKTFRKASAASQKKIPVKQKVSYSNFLAKTPANAKKYMVDLRVHTPGTVGYFTSGGVQPGPALVRLAKVKGLDMIGLTDFYNASYIDVIHETVANPDIAIVPGIDLCVAVGSCRDVHVTALFPETYRSAQLQEVLNQLAVPAHATGRSDYCLDRPFSEILDIVESNGGVVIPSQLDKTPYRQLAIPPLVEIYGIRAFDLVHPENTEYFKERWPDGEFAFFSFSNSTALAQIGSRVARVKLSSPTFAGVAEMCARKKKGE